MGTKFAVLGGLAVLLVGCSGEGGLGEAPQIDEEAMNTASCATAARDAVVRTTQEQTTGVDSPSVYDNPGCNEGYIVEYDGSVGGVHYGYRAETPRADSTDGIQVRFEPRSTNSPAASCEGAIRAGGYLYEKRATGTWRLAASKFVESRDLGSPGLPPTCIFPVITFASVQKGSAETPHIYRTALTMDILNPNPFSANLPDGQGYGVIHQEACDAIQQCTCGDQFHPCQ
jgi:hypothetical protein